VNDVGNRPKITRSRFAAWWRGARATI